MFWFFAIKCKEIKMSNFILALVSIVYGLVCLTQEADQGKCSTSKSAEDSSEKGAEGELKTMTSIERKKTINWG